MSVQPMLGTRSVCQMCSEPIVYAEFVVGRERAKRSGWRHVSTNPRHMAVPDDGPVSTPLDQVSEAAAAARLKNLEHLAAAFLAATGLRPDECELVEEHRGNCIAFYFRRRT